MPNGACLHQDIYSSKMQFCASEKQMSQKILNHCEGIPAAVQSDSAT
jgi:hypothetical protein